MEHRDTAPKSFQLRTLNAAATIPSSNIPKLVESTHTVLDGTIIQELCVVPKIRELE